MEIALITIPGLQFNEISVRVLSRLVSKTIKLLCDEPFTLSEVHTTASCSMIR